MNLKKFGYYNAVMVSPSVSIANPIKNMDVMIDVVNKHLDKDLIVFPELSLTGYSCEDLFLIDDLYLKINESLKKLKSIKEYQGVLVFGLPIKINSSLYNCAAIVSQGNIIGLVPKTFIPEYNEFYEKRWFSSGKDLDLLWNNIPLKTKQIFKYGKLKIGIEICEDLWSPLSPSISHSINGANTILNLSSSPELVGKNKDRKLLIRSNSYKSINHYIYVSSGRTESTKDVVFGGHCLSVENGTLLKESKRFKDHTETITTIDINKIDYLRLKNKTFSDNKNNDKDYLIHDISCENKTSDIYIKVNPKPFIPNKNKKEIYKDISNIQSSGLKKRLDSIGPKTKIILGLSGGLDSTLALLVARKTVSSDRIIAVTMPGPGTSKKTLKNAKLLAKKLKIKLLEIDINKSVKLHLDEINHKKIDITYENTQARKRSLYLFNLANKYNGIVLGTGDLSEIALGWATYNGDHMSHYNVNASIPKTLVRDLVNYYRIKFKKASNVLKSIINTEISPELLPLDNGEIKQKTEDILGSYMYHDFYLYNLKKYGYSKEKIKYLAEIAFSDKNEVNRTINIFFNRFQKNQFKRTVFTAGPKVGSVSLSPRGDWRMPDEGKLW